MAWYHEHSIDEYTKFLTGAWKNNYGISEEKIADWFVQQRGARAVMISYGVNKSNLLSTYIPKLKEKLGGYVMFLLYTVTEAGGAGNWINHYGSDTSSTGLGCLIDDCDYLINKCFPGHLPIARSAPEVGGSYIPDVPGQDTEVYGKCEPASIGTGIMPSTMAGNAWTFGPHWCQARGVYFGNPYDQMIDYIQLLGGNPFNPDAPNIPNPSNGSPKEDTGSKIAGDAAKAVNWLLEQIKKALEFDVHDISLNKYFYTNGFLKVEKTYNNTYHLWIRADWLEKLQDKLNTWDVGIPTDNQPPKDVPPSIPSGKNSTTMQRIYDFCKNNLGKSFDVDGMYGAQCVDLVLELNKQFNLHLVTSGDVAKHIYNNPVPDGWHKVPGDPANDSNSQKIWDALPNGTIVWFTNSGAGHVAVKTGNWADCIQQNYNSPNGGLYGGPMVEANLKGWISSGGAGFLGAWVADK